MLSFMYEDHSRVIEMKPHMKNMVDQIRENAYRFINPEEFADIE